MKNCTRFFTQEEIDEIRMRLAAVSGAKDSQFEKALPIDGTEQLAIVQAGKNKLADINQLKSGLWTMDTVPTYGSENAVTSDGIYNYIQEVIHNIPVGGDNYIYISSDSEMFDYLIHGSGHGSGVQEKYNNYCNQVYQILQNGGFIIIDNAICVSSIEGDLTQFSLRAISDSKYITAGAYQDESNQWHVIPGSGVTTSRYLIDTRMLSRTLGSYATTTYVNGKIAQEEASINILSNKVGSIDTAFRERMDVTPKYQRADWIEREAEWEVTEKEEIGVIDWDPTKQVQPEERFQSLAWAIHDNKDTYKSPKLIILDGSTAIDTTYAEDGGTFPNSVTTITLGYIIGTVYVIYTISKREKIYPQDNDAHVYLYIEKSAYPIINRPTPSSQEPIIQH